MTPWAPYLFFTLAGYLSGSVLYAQLLTRWIAGKDVRTAQEDHNPGTASAFLCGGLACGIPVLICDLLKGFLPVHWALRFCLPSDPLFVFVLLAPVIGHAWPLFYHFEGGKAIAVSFGVLLGLCPLFCLPLLALVFFYLLYSLLVKITPHSWRTICTFCSALLVDWMAMLPISIFLGFSGITMVVSAKHLQTRPEHPEVHLLPEGHR